MQQYLAMILIIAPGFLVRTIHEDLTWDRVVKSDFEKTIISLIYSIPIFAINFLILWCYKIKTINELIEKFNSVSFIFKYAILTIVSSLVFIGVWSIIYPNIAFKIVNLIRDKRNLNIIDERPTAWDAFINDGQKFKAVRIVKSGKEIGKGFVSKWNFKDGNEKEICLEKEKVFDLFPNAFDEVESTYYNFDKDLIISKYNLEKLNLLIKDKKRDSTNP